MNLEQSWIDFLTTLFERDGWEVLPRNASEPKRFHTEPDLALSQRGMNMVVEVKLIRSPNVSLATLRNAVASIKHILEDREGYRGLIVIPQSLSKAAKAAFESAAEESVDLWDLHSLVRHTAVFPGLISRLVDLLRALQIGAEDAPTVQSQLAMLQEMDEPPLTGEGARLAEEFDLIKPGNKKKAAQAFEKLCESALVLLFGNELIGWRRQSQIEFGYQRVDLIARLQPSNSAFWQTLASDFRARYVVFEFKNYTGQIGQDQIYTTERYLYATALRSVAIIIARNGYDENANRTVQGALREQGKLILCLTLVELQEMLRAFDSGDEYENILLARRDNLLMSLAR